MQASHALPGRRPGPAPWAPLGICPAGAPDAAAPQLGAGREGLLATTTTTTTATATATATTTTYYCYCYYYY